MTLTLLTLASLVALNPCRAAAAAPADHRARVAAMAAGATLGLVVAAALCSGPLLDALGVTGASARIAAGIAMLAVALKDVAARPPAAEPALAGTRAGLVPLAFPVMFTPGVAMVAIAGAADRGVGAAVATAVPGVALAAGAVVVGAALGRRPLVSTVGAVGAAVAALVTLDGVYAI